MLKKDSPEFEMISQMAKRDFGILKEKLDKKGDNILDGISRYLLLVEHSARHDIYDELGVDVSEYNKLIKESMIKTKMNLRR